MNITDCQANNSKQEEPRSDPVRRKTTRLITNSRPSDEPPKIELDDEVLDSSPSTETGDENLGLFSSERDHNMNYNKHSISTDSGIDDPCKSEALTTEIDLPTEAEIQACDVDIPTSIFHGSSSDPDQLTAQHIITTTIEDQLPSTSSTHGGLLSDFSDAGLVSAALTVRSVSLPDLGSLLSDDPHLAPQIINTGDSEDSLSTSFGFVYSLDAPTSGMVRKGDDPLTYINKDQFYCLTLEFKPKDDYHLPKSQIVSSIIMLEFRDKNSPEEALQSWEFWHLHQNSLPLRALEAAGNDCLGLIGGVEEVAHNAILVRWCPLQSHATVVIAVQCLSTDFSPQKGVKGVPLHFQIDTYDEQNPTNVIVDRAFCQIKIFCDKGAERKSREEEKRMVRCRQQGRDSALQGVQSRSFFQRSSDLVSVPFLFVPRKQIPQPPLDPTIITVAPTRAMSNEMSFSASPAHTPQPPIVLPTTAVAQVELRLNQETSRKRPRLSSSSSSTKTSDKPVERIMIFVKQENEDVYTALHIAPPTVQGLIQAISTKYMIDSTEIRYLYKKNLRGIVAKIDDDMIRYHTNEDVFQMKVLSTEDSESGSVHCDFIFQETQPHQD